MDRYRLPLFSIIRKVKVPIMAIEPDLAQTMVISTISRLISNKENKTSSEK